MLTARHQSFSRAAEQLFITQSGMSVLVRELESQLGFRLFERTTRKVALTELGSRFLPIVGPRPARARGGRGEPEPLGGGRERTLAIGAAVSGGRADAAGDQRLHGALHRARTSSWWTPRSRA